MKRSSWIVIAVCSSLLCVLWFLYIQSQRTPPEMTHARVETMLNTMKSAVERKDVKSLMTYVDNSPETRVSHLNPDQLRLLLSRAFRQSEHLQADYKNLAVHPGQTESTVEFELSVTHHLTEGDGEDYKGHITLHLQLQEIPHILGLYHTKEWRIVKAETTGQDLATYGDY